MKCITAYLLTLTTSVLPVIAQPFQLGVDETHVVPQALREGAIFDERNLPPEQIVSWYRIPKWYAGTTIRTSLKKFVFSVQSIRTKEHGRQFDAKGRVWECRREPIEYPIDHKNCIVHTALINDVPVAVTRDRVAMQTRALMIIERKSDHRITKSFYTDQLHVFTPAADGSINARIDNAVFYKQNGSYDFKQIGAVTYVERKTAEFKPTDRDEKHDYRGSFIAYLRSTGQDDLIPTDKPRSTWDDIEEQEQLLTR